MTLDVGDDAVLTDFFDNAYVYDNLKNKFARANAKATVTNPQAGMVVFDTTEQKLWGYTGSTWIDLTSSSAVDITVTAGENLAIRDCVYVELTGALGTAGRAYKADADIAAKSSSGWTFGFATAAITSGNTGVIRIGGILSGFAGKTAGAIQYVSATGGELTESAPANSKIMGIALTSSTVLVDIRGPNDAVMPYGYNQGYFLGGDTSGVGGYVVTTDKITYSSDSTAACTSADLSAVRAYTSMGGISKVNSHGYIGGGWTLAAVDIADKVTYSTDGTAACTSADLSVARHVLAGVSEGTSKGYFAGGNTGAIVATADKTTFSSDVTAACTTADLSLARVKMAGISEGSSKGYIGGGQTKLGALNNSTISDKITFSSDSTAACTSADLTLARRQHTGCSGNSSKGYFAGGDTGAGPPVKVAIAEKITYSIDSLAACASADLSTIRHLLSGTSEKNSKGYFGGGDSGTIITTVDKIILSADTTAACTSANLSQARRSLTAMSGNSV